MFGIPCGNTTFQSAPDNHGNTYRASFELYPFYEGKELAVYKGMLNGNSPKRGCFCAVKARLGRNSNKEDWAEMVKILQTAKHLASGFNYYLQQKIIFFTSPLLAQVDSVSYFTGIVKCFKPHRKKLSKGEYVILEDFISDEFRTFSSASGIGNPKHETEVTQAFSHFTWDDTRDHVVCGLQGIRTENGYHFSSPAIHSVSGRFGQNDCRWDGIVEFFSAHRCNNICTGWNIPEIAQFPVESYSTSGYNLNNYNVRPATAPPPYSYKPPGNLRVYS